MNLTSRMSLKNITGEAWGGLAAMLVVLPSAIAFGVAIFAPLGPEYVSRGALAGIVGAVALGLVAPATGGTARLVTAPCAPAAAVLAALTALLAAPVARHGAGLDAATILPLFAITALFTGLFQILFGLLRGGRLIKYIPYPVVSGYLSGVGILILLKQLPNLFGLARGVGLGRGLLAPSLWSVPALITGLATTVLMLLAGKWTRKIPAPILGLGGGMAVYFGLAVFEPGLRVLAGNPLVVGPLATGDGLSSDAIAGAFAALARTDPSLFALVLWPSLTLAVLLSIDTLKTCVVLDAVTRSRHDSNRELLGQGLGNVAASFLGGVPGSGTIGATLINVGSGGKTRLSGMLAGAFALVALLAFSGLVAWVPLPALAGILCLVAFRMIDRRSFTLLKQPSTYLDFAVVAAVVAVAVAGDLVTASAVGVGLAILLFLREQIRSAVVRRKTYGDQTFSRCKRLPDEQALLEAHGRETAIYELQGSLFFGTTDKLLTELEADLKTCRHIVLDMRRVQSVDFTAAHLLEQIQERLAEHGGRLVFSDIPRSLPSGRDLQAYFDEVGIARAATTIPAFATLNDAIEWTESRVLEESGLAAKGHGAPLDLAGIDLFAGLDEETLGALRAIVTEREVPEGGIIFAAGEAGDELFLIRKGTVKITLPLADGKTRHLASFERGDFFGEIAFLDRNVRTAIATAATRAWLYVLARSAVEGVARERPHLGRKLFSRLARALAIRLRQADAQIRELEES